MKTVTFYIYRRVFSSYYVYLGTISNDCTYFLQCYYALFFFQNPILFLKNNSYTARSDEYSSKSLTLVYRNYRWNRAWLPSSSKYDFLVQIPRVTIMEFPWSYGCICACKIQSKITCVLHLLKNDIYTRARMHNQIC